MITIKLTDAQAGLIKELIRKELENEEFKQETLEELQEYLGAKQGEKSYLQIYGNLELIKEQLKDAKNINEEESYSMELAKLCKEDIYDYVIEDSKCGDDEDD